MRGRAESAEGLCSATPADEVGGEKSRRQGEDRADDCPAHEQVAEEFRDQLRAWNCAHPFERQGKPVATENQGSYLRVGEEQERSERRNGDLHPEQHRQAVEPERRGESKADQGLEAVEGSAAHPHPEGHGYAEPAGLGMLMEEAGRPPSERITDHAEAFPESHPHRVAYPRVPAAYLSG